MYWNTYTYTIGYTYAIYKPKQSVIMGANLASWSPLIWTHGQFQISFVNTFSYTSPTPCPPISLHCLYTTTGTSYNVWKLSTSTCLISIVHKSGFWCWRVCIYNDAVPDVMVLEQEYINVTNYKDKVGVKYPRSASKNIWLRSVKQPLPWLNLGVDGCRFTNTLNSQNGFLCCKSHYWHYSILV